MPRACRTAKLRMTWFGVRAGLPTTEDPLFMWWIDVLATPAAVLLMAGRAARAGGHAVRGVAELSAPAAIQFAEESRCRAT